MQMHLPRTLKATERRSQPSGRGIVASSINRIRSAFARLKWGLFGIDKTGDPLKQQPPYLHVPVYLTYVKNTTATAPCGYLSYRVNGALR